jgi:Flp pilus assembly pilin Flp
MATATKILIRACESGIRNMRGEAMTEYSLIFAAIALLVYSTYRTLDNNIYSIASGIDSTLINACRSVLRHR